MNNKKAALIFAPILLVLMVGGLLWAWSVVKSKREAFNEDIGEKQFKLINIYQAAEKALFYTDQAAKYSAYLSIHDLAETGGCITKTENQYSGYTLWDLHEKKPECYPTREYSRNTFFDILQKNLDNYLSGYTDAKFTEYDNIELLQENYDFIYDTNILVGNAKEKLEIPIPGKDKDSEPSGTYYINSSFKVTVGYYDFSDYEELIGKAEQFLEECKGENPDRCVADEKSKETNFFNDENFVWKSCESGDDGFLEEIDGPEEWIRYRIFGFCVESKENKFYIYYDGTDNDEDDGQITLRNVIYKFALPFEYLSCSNDDYGDTHCREFSCGEYNEFNTCVEIEVCFCPDTDDSPYINACEGECPLCWCSDWTQSGCAECGMTLKRTCKPSGCDIGGESSCEYACECDPCCVDPCSCDPTLPECEED